MTSVKITQLKGKQIKDYINELAKLRIETFKEYPYLYEGNLEYEQKYLSTYTNCDETLLILVQDGERVVGCSTAIPLEFESIECQQPFLDNNLNIKEYFYLGESVLLPQYRGQGIYRHFFEARENAAKEYGSKVAAFCGVVREENDKRQPPNYEPLNKIWQHFGYQKSDSLVSEYSWKEVGAKEETKHDMIYWIKQLI